MKIKRYVRVLAAVMSMTLLLSGCALTEFQWSDLKFWGDGDSNSGSHSQITAPDNYNRDIAEKYTTFAIFGVDARDTTTLNSGVNSDVIMIVSINNETKDVKVVSVYRDTIMKMPDGSYNKINYVQAKWNAAETVNALNENLDIYITDYVVVNWAATATVVNLLGGIEIDVPESMMPYINGYLTETVDSTAIGSVPLESSGLQVLDGPQTVAYCRIRAIDNDYNRTERQREVVQKILEKAKSAGAATVLQIAAAVLSQIQTTFDWADIASLCSGVADYSLSDTSGFPFDKASAEYCASLPDVSWPCFAQDMSANVTQLHEFLYGEDEEYTPGEQVVSISDYLESIR